MNNIKFTLLIGMPGSGKTTLGNKMSNENTIFLDDLSMLCKDAESYLSKIILDNPTIFHYIISDVYFCQTNILQSAINIFKKINNDCIVEFIYFENNSKLCHNNILYRKKLGDLRKVDNLIDLLTKNYIIPENINPIQIKNMLNIKN